MLNPKISLIIPTHNSEKYIDRALNSARSQTFSDIEIICIDSSKDDATPEILDRYASEDERFRVLFDGNSSYGHKINRGIDEARGQYIAILEADDLLINDSLKTLWDAVCRFDHQLDYVKAEHMDFSEEGDERREERKYHYTEDVYNKIINLQDKTDLWEGAWNRIWTGLYKVSFLRNNAIRLNESPGASYQDTGFGVLCNMYADRVCFIPDVVYMYRRDNEESSVKNDKKYMMIKGEFDWIDEQLQTRKLLNDRNYPAYKAFKTEIFRWNMTRISEEYGRSFKNAVISSSDYPIKVSVLMPSLNVVRYIKQCVNSVLAQTLKEIEIICIDAGSTDGTLEILKEYAADHTNVKMIISDKKSYGHQMNQGLSMAKGEYIGIVETDDFVDERMFETLYQNAKWYDVDVAKALPFDCYDQGDGSTFKKPVIYNPDTIMTGKISFPEEYPMIHAWDNNIWNGIYRRSFIEENHIVFRETAGAAYQDIGFQQRVLNKAKDYICLPHYFYHYRKDRPGSSTVSEKCVNYIIDEYRSLISDRELKESRFTAVYERMICASLDEIEKYLQWRDFDMARLNCKPEIEWLYEKTLYAINRGIIRPDNTNPARWTRIKRFSLGIDEYIDSYKQRIVPLRDWFRTYDEISSGRKTVIFGTGNYGQDMITFMIRNGIIPVSICDNNPYKLPMSFYGISTNTTEDAVVKHPTAAFVIASKNNWKEMRAQLEFLGVSEKRIAIFNGSEPGIVDALRNHPVIYGIRDEKNDE